VKGLERFRRRKGTTTFHLKEIELAGERSPSTGKNHQPGRKINTSTKNLFHRGDFSGFW